MTCLRRVVKGGRTRAVPVYLQFAVAFLLPIVARFLIARDIVSTLNRDGLHLTYKVIEQGEPRAADRKMRDAATHRKDQLRPSSGVWREPLAPPLQIVRAAHFWSRGTSLLADVVLALTLVIGISMALAYRPEDVAMNRTIRMLLPAIAGGQLLLRWATDASVIYNMGSGLSSVITPIYDLFEMIRCGHHVGHGIDVGPALPWYLILLGIVTAVGWWSAWCLWGCWSGATKQKHV